MGQGPFGGPRISDIGPLATDSVEVSENIEKKSRSIIPAEAEKLLKAKGIDIPSGAQEVTVEIEVKQEVEESELGVLQEFQQAAADLGKSIAYTRYVVLPENIAYISKTFVKEKFRRNGLGSTVRSRAMDEMRKHGIQEAYTYPVSPAGEALVKSQGFVDSDIENLYVKRLS